MLVIVQGISFANNLKGVADDPVVLDIENRLVYSAHVQAHQKAVFHYDTYENTEKAFNLMFGFIDEWENHAYSAPVIVGGLSGSSPDSNHWQFINQYLDQRHSSFNYWAINADSPASPLSSRTGLMDPSWENINQPWKIHALQNHMRGIPLFNVHDLPGMPDKDKGGRYDHKKHGIRRFNETNNSTGVLYGLVSFT